MTKKRFINDIDNGQLIDIKGELSTIDYSDKVDFYELWEFLNKLNDENEQLKAQLYCDDEEGVCNICEHHYLVKDNETELGYYNSRCKKGHYECARISLKHCKDFEKELDE